MFSALSHCFRGIPIYAVIQDATLVHLSFSKSGHAKALARLGKAAPAPLRTQAETASRLTRQLNEYLNGERREFALPVGTLFLDQGTPFQRRVWQLLGQIPYGEIRTYGELAARLGGRGYARAVGRACNTNPLALIIPCHRVVARDGTGGFAGGERLKQQLLAIEQRDRGDR